MTKPLSVLFADVGAPSRAPMAAGLLHHLTRGRVFVRYASTVAEPPVPLLETVLREVDVELGTARCAGDGAFDVVVLLTAPGACPPALALAPSLATGQDGEPAWPGELAPQIAPAGDNGLVSFRLRWEIPGPEGPGSSSGDADGDALLAAHRETRDAVRSHVETFVRHGYLAAMERHLRSSWEYADHPVARTGPGGPNGDADARDRGVASFHGMMGRSGVIREIFRTVRQVGASDYPVLVTGESGTGKELVASAVHAESRRACGPFVPINCGALPENILESELFGHVRGAFTGAIRDKKGRFELAHGGTLFLDEIGELTPAFQVKLLRVLQEKSFERVGGERPISVDVRIISATNRDLRTLVRNGTFREDLFYRLCVVPIVLPPLRERPEDILPIADQALRLIRDETGRASLSLTDGARRLLLEAPWPGNVRQLIGALQFAAVHATGDEIDASHLPPEVRVPPPALSLASPLPPGAMTAVAPATAPGDERGRPRKLDRPAVERALLATHGNRAKAARLLGVSRATLYRFFKDDGGA